MRPPPAPKTFVLTVGNKNRNPGSPTPGRVTITLDGCEVRECYGSAENLLRTAVEFLLDERLEVDAVEGVS